MAFINEVLPDSKTIEVVFPASTAFDVGYLIYDASGTPTKASGQADQGSESANQALFASNFLGITADKRLSTETVAQKRVVIADGVFDCTCPSTTWAVGDLVGASENGDGNALLDQQVERVTDPSLAIGYCVRATSGASTTVRARLISRKVPAALDRTITYQSYYFTGTPAATDQVVFVAPHKCRVVAIAEVHSAAAGGASTLQVVKDTSTSAPGAGTDLLSAAFDLNATANTTQQGALSATASDLVLNAGDRLSVDFANAIQSSAGVCVTIGIVPAG